MSYQLIQGNALVEMGQIADGSVDAIICDPPYEFGFMSKAWDKSGIAYSVEVWKEVYRVLKPGAHLLAFGGTRTSHRMVCAIEDAGFEIRDSIRYMGQIVSPAWVYGSGMPKSLNISKAIDQQLGEHREKKRIPWSTNVLGGGIGIDRPWKVEAEQNGYHEVDNDMAISDEAKQFSGFGTNLAPSWEPICLAHKPIAAATIAENVLQYGTGGLNIDATRIEAPGTSLARNNAQGDNGWKNSSGGKNAAAVREEQGLPTLGRWPKNVFLDDSPEIMAEFARYGERSSGEKKPGGVRPQGHAMNGHPGERTGHFNSSTGTAARFFYSAKASQSERHENGDNEHPTVKPVSLMEYLCKLVTPPGGIILDCFLGSGTTGVAALRNKFDFIGIELSPEYFAIAQRRIEDAARAANGLPKQLIGHESDCADMPLFEVQP